MRVLLTGMGSELGTRVTTLLEADPAVDRIVGIDADPPRRRIGRAEFHLLDPVDTADAVELGQVVADADPTVLIHLAVYEPDARLRPHGARVGTEAFARATRRALAWCRSLEHVVLRSGVEVYGRGRGAPAVPDEEAPVAPTSPYGRSLAAVEHDAAEIGPRAGATVTVLRCAPIVGPHVPSPLGRHLRLPVVAVGALPTSRFSVLHQADAAAAIVAAAHARHDGPLNVVGPGSVNPWEAARLGGGIPVPTLGLGWVGARVGGEALGAPLPDHVVELLTRGRRADGDRVGAALGWSPTRTTRDVIGELHDWAPVTHLHGHVTLAEEDAGRDLDDDLDGATDVAVLTPRPLRSRA
jgi:UDP-glucose 4-epimerase